MSLVWNWNGNYLGLILYLQNYTYSIINNYYSPFHMEWSLLGFKKKCRRSSPEEEEVKLPVEPSSWLLKCKIDIIACKKTKNKNKTKQKTNSKQLHYILFAVHAQTLHLHFLGRKPYTYMYTYTVYYISETLFFYLFCYFFLAWSEKARWHHVRKN